MNSMNTEEKNTEKDCFCHGHSGPHWLYLDYLAREHNLGFLKWAVYFAKKGNAEQAYCNLQAFALAEEDRLDTKLMEMSTGKAYPYSLLVPGMEVEDLNKKQLDLLKQIEDICKERVL